MKFKNMERWPIYRKMRRPSVAYSLENLYTQYRLVCLRSFPTHYYPRPVDDCDFLYRVSNNCCYKIDGLESFFLCVEQLTDSQITEGNAKSLMVNMCGDFDASSWQVCTDVIL